MEILLVNNHTRHLPQMLGSLTRHQVEIVDYHPGVDFSLPGKDAIILSGGGGEGKEAGEYHYGNRWYEDELDLIDTTRLPVLGVCKGHQLICLANGARIEKLDQEIEGPKTIQGYAPALPREFTQYGSHEWHAVAPDSNLVVEAVSSGDVIEIVKHKRKPQRGVQWHPELAPGDIGLDEAITRIAA